METPRLLTDWITEGMAAELGAGSLKIKVRVGMCINSCGCEQILILFTLQKTQELSRIG